MGESLKGKSAIITGGASGRGQALAEALSAQGAQVALADWDEVGGQAAARIIQDAGGESFFHKTDVSKKICIR